MKTEATLLRAIANATTLREQAGLVSELDALRRAEASRLQDERDTDLSSTLVGQALSPVLTHSMHTASTDWLDEVAPTALDTNRVIAEAAMWFGKTSSAVKADHHEFAEQARGQARRLAGAYGEQAREAERAYLDYVAFLHRREAASGLPQIQQLIDGNNNPSRTEMPQDVFDTFEQPVAPENGGVDEMQSSYNAPLMNEILQEGNGQGSPEWNQGHGEGAGPSQNPMGGNGMQVGYNGSERQASLVDAPSVGISHAYNLDEFREAQRREASLRATAGEVDERGEDGKCRNCVNGNHSGTNGTPGCRGKGCTCSNSNCGKVRNMKNSTRAEAASSLPQVQQLIDVHDQPAPTPLPQDVMFPLIPEFQKEHEAENDARTASRDPRLSRPDAPVSRRPFGKEAVAEENPEASKDFVKAYAFARNWKGGSIVRKGSVEFEAGLYAGMKDNTPEAQQAWLDAHQKWATKEPYFGTRIEVHAAFTKQAGTTTDLDTMDPGLNNPTPHDTPINGPGTVPPLAGGTDPARAGGAAPYNGAAPFSTPVAPDPGWQDPQRRMAAFRAQVTAASEPKNTPVCRGCGEAFESRAVAEEAHGKKGCGTEDGERGYEMKRESEAW